MISKKLYLFLINFCIFTLINSHPSFPSNSDELNSDYWINLAKKDLEKSKARKDIIGKAKNVILFIGDGMGVSTLTAARIFKGQLAGKSGEEEQLFLETFPDSALIKTYNVNMQVPDSAGTATAIMSGIKANFKVIGLSPKITLNQNDCDKIQENLVDSILESARKSGKSIGLVTTTRITHATPAAAYAHINNRDYETDIKLPDEFKKGKCKDIARQLIENEPGKSLNVIFGGGLSYFISKSNKTSGLREDGRNLINDWLKYKKESGLKEEEYKFVSNLNEFRKLDTQKVKHVLGLFAKDHLSYNAYHNNKLNEPKFSEMVEKAIEILSKNQNDYILIAEAGRIDHAHHNNSAGLALYETIELDNAIEKTMKIINKEDTLVIVTADHSHSLTINGYPKRGNNILNLSGYSDIAKNISFTTLLYSSGPGNNPDGKDMNNNSYFNSLNYRQHAAYKLTGSNHGGEDVALYSTGPMSYLFRGLHEQNYIHHVIAFSTCIGLYKNETHC